MTVSERNVFDDEAMVLLLYVACGLSGILDSHVASWIQETIQTRNTVTVLPRAHESLSALGMGLAC